MKFGKVDNIENIDFRLPPDLDSSIAFESADHTFVYTGATSWNKSEWKESLYPKKCKKADFLKIYSAHFNSIELNATHYRTPSDKSIDIWKNESPDDFKFCPKVLQAISHRNDMLANKELLNRFILQLSKLENKLGQVFLQLPPYFKYKNLPYLRAFLKVWPQEMPLAVELRDEEIHKSPSHFQEYLEILREYHCTPLITDVSGRRDLLHMSLTTPRVFVRWVGNGLHKSDFERIRDWKNRVLQWSKRGVNEIYFMLHEPENLRTPEIAEFMAAELQGIESIIHRGPKIITEIPNLFS